MRIDGTIGTSNFTLTGITRLEIDGKPYQVDNTLPADLTFGLGTIPEQTGALKNWLLAHPAYDAFVVIDGQDWRPGSGATVRLMTHYGKLELERAPDPTAVSDDTLKLMYKAMGETDPNAYRKGMSTIDPATASLLYMKVGVGGRASMLAAEAHRIAYYLSFGPQAIVPGVNVPKNPEVLTGPQYQAIRAIPWSEVNRMFEGKEPLNDATRAVMSHPNP